MRTANAYQSKLKGFISYESPIVHFDPLTTNLNHRLVPLDLDKTLGRGNRAYYGGVDLEKGVLYVQ